MSLLKFFCSPQEGATVDELMVHTEQALTNIRILYFEFSQLAKHVAKVSIILGICGPFYQQGLTLIPG